MAIITNLFVFLVLAVLRVTAANIAEAKVTEAYRQSLIRQLQLERLVTHQDGWTNKARRFVEEAAEIRKDEELKNQAAATLVGIDAKTSKHFKEFGASSVAFDPHSKRLLIGGLDNEDAKLWDGTTDEPLHSKQIGAGPVAFRANGTPLQLSADPKDRLSLLLCDVAKQRIIYSFRFPAKGKQEPLTSRNAPLMALTPDGVFLAASTALAEGKGILAVWNGDTGKLIYQSEKMVTALALSPDGKWLAVGDADGQITTWSLPKGGQVATLSAGRMEIQSLAFGRDAYRHVAKEKIYGEKGATWLLAAGDAAANVTIWDLQTQTPKSYCRGSQHGIYALAFSGDGVTLASSDRERTRLWDISTGHLLLSLQTGYETTGLAFSPDGQKLATSDIPCSKAVNRFFSRGCHTLYWHCERSP